METPTFRILRHGAATIVKSADSAYASWARGDYTEALASLDQIATDADMLGHQARGMSQVAKATAKPSSSDQPQSASR